MAHAQSSRTGKELQSTQTLLARSIQLSHKAIGPLLSLLSLRRDCNQAMKSASESASSFELEKFKQQTQKTIQSKASTEEVEEGLGRKASVVELQNLRDMLLAQFDASKRAETMTTRRRSVQVSDQHLLNSETEDLVKQLCLGIENAHDRLDTELVKFARKEEMQDMDKAVRTVAGQVKRLGIQCADKVWVDDQLVEKADKGEFQRYMMQL